MLSSPHSSSGKGDTAISEEETGQGASVTCTKVTWHIRNEGGIRTLLWPDPDYWLFPRILTSNKFKQHCPDGFKTGIRSRLAARMCLAHSKCSRNAPFRVLPAQYQGTEADGARCLAGGGLHLCNSSALPCLCRSLTHPTPNPLLQVGVSRLLGARPARGAACKFGCGLGRTNRSQAWTSS